MTDKPETHEERLTRLNFHSDIARSVLHDCSKDLLETFAEQEIRNAASCLLTGACQFVAELYEETAQHSGVVKADMREHMLSSIATYFDHYAKISDSEVAQTVGAA